MDPEIIKMDFMILFKALLPVGKGDKEKEKLHGYIDTQVLSQAGPGAESTTVVWYNSHLLGVRVSRIALIRENFTPMKWKVYKVEGTPQGLSIG